MNAYAQAREVRGQPQIIVAHTDKGKFLTPFTKDTVARKHGVALTEAEQKIALEELDERHKQWQDAQANGGSDGNR